MGLIRDMIINAAGKAAQEAVRDVAIGAVALVAGVAEGVTKGVQKVSGVAAKIGTPITKKRIEKLSQECEDLYLLSVDRQNGGKHIQFFTSNVDLCLSLVKENKNSEKYKLIGVNDRVVAEVKRKRRLFKEYLSITTSDGIEHTFSEAPHSENKTNFELDKQMKIVRNNILSDYDFYYKERKIATLKRKPANSVDYALQVFDNQKDLNIILMAIGIIVL